MNFIYIFFLLSLTMSCNENAANDAIDACSPSACCVQRSALTRSIVDDFATTPSSSSLQLVVAVFDHNDCDAALL